MNSHMQEVTFQAKERLVRAYGFHLLAWSLTAWDRMVERLVEDILDAEYLKIQEERDER